jgi:hypothetical protein
MTYEEQLYGAIGELTVRHVYLDEEIAYFYNKLGEVLGVSVASIEHRFFNDKLKLLKKLVEQDPNREFANRLLAWIQEADKANKLRNEVVHATFSILEKDPIVGPTQYLQAWKRANVRKAADLAEMKRLSLALSMLVAKLSLLLNRNIGSEEWRQLSEQVPLDWLRESLGQ